MSYGEEFWIGPPVVRRSLILFALFDFSMKFLKKKNNNINVLQHCIALPLQYKENLITCYRHPSDHFKI